MPETRQELEARLRTVSDSMTHRLSQMEREVKLPTPGEIVQSVPPRTAWRVGSAVGVGLLVGLVLGGRSRAARKRAGSVWPDELAEAVARLLKEGSEPRDAVRRAVGRRPPPEDGGPNGLLAFILGYAVKQGTNALVREIVNRVTSRNGSDKAT